MSLFVVSAFIAFAVFYAAFFFSGVVAKSLQEARDERNSPQYEVKLRNQAREESLSVKCFGPLIDAVDSASKNKSLREAYDHYLDLKEMSPPWNGGLYLATKKVEAFLFGLFVAVVAFLFAGMGWAVISGLAFGFFFYFASVFGLKSEADEIKEKILRRLPFVVDLMALIRLANGSFVESLEIVAKENADHPIGKVFSKAYSESKFGKTQREVLEGMAARMKDPSFREIATSIIQADELGRPVAATLSELAGQMRLKRQQMGEVLSGQAQVNIIYPGFVIMSACLLVIAAPFILLALRDYL